MQVVSSLPIKFAANFIGLPSQSGQHYEHPQAEHRKYMAERISENTFYPFDNEAQFYLAELMARPNIKSEREVRRACVDGRERFLRPEVGFSSYADFISRLDILRSCHASWVERKIYPRSVGQRSQWDGKVSYWAKDPLAVLQEILENENLKDKCVWAPVKEYSADGERIYTDLHTADWWWSVQVVIIYIPSR